MGAGAYTTGKYAFYKNSALLKRDETKSLQRFHKQLLPA
jgi:hypothetical protein